MHKAAQVGVTLVTFFFLMSAHGLAESRPNSLRPFHGKGVTFEVDFTQAAAPSAHERDLNTNRQSDGRVKDLNEYSVMGVTLQSRSTEKDFGRGVPVRFASGGIGLLTNAILASAESKDILREIVPDAQSIVLLIGTTDIFRISFATPEAAFASLQPLDQDDRIRFAHPDFRLPLEQRSAIDPIQEPLWPSQWHLQTLGVASAWPITMGSSSTLVALIDLGFETDHPDLKDAWFINPREISGNRKDDDGNGLVDDVSGWNFGVGGPNLLYGAGPGHGTATAGIIGARANGIGAVGICPACRILPIVIDDQVSSAVSAFLYARLMGATVISNSWGYRIGTPETQALVEAIHRMAVEGRGGKGASIVFAMGNKGRDDCRGSEPDISALPTVIAVSSADNQDKKISYAGYGACLAILAPSSDERAHGVVTTDRRGAKGFNTGSEVGDLTDLDFTNSFHGTSAAAPQVAAALALLYSACPGLGAEEAREILLKSADKVHPAEAQYDVITGRSLHYGYGRLNVGAMLDEALLGSTAKRCAITKNKEDGTDEA